MFDFFFKRARAASTPGSGAAVTVANTLAAPAAPDLSQRRQQALDQAAAIGADESAALAFLIGCQVPEARLRAAEQLHSRPMLEQAQKAMRETDRRVSKLMQQRLSNLAQQERSEQRMHAAIARAQALIAEAIVLPNQAVDLDRARMEAGSVSSSLEAQFAALRAELAERLQSQAALQRRAMDVRTVLQTRLAASDGTDSAQLDLALQDADAAIQAIERDRALASLPKHLMPELRAARSQLLERHDVLRATEAAIAAREQALDEWQQVLAESGMRRDAPGNADRAAAIADDNASVNTDASADANANANANANAHTDAPVHLAGAGVDVQPALRELSTPQSLRQQWQALPAVRDVEIDAALQARFDALLASVAPAARPNRTNRPALPTAGAAAIESSAAGQAVAGSGADAAQVRATQTAALQELRSALDEGALQRAVEQDRLLRSLEAGATRLKAEFTSEQQAALSAARAELARLQGWARWGGTVSREELVVAVEGLPQQGLGVAELGKKVGSMRERWRALDATAGPAARPLWLRFDAACGTAYAPVAAHFAELARQREVRLENARAIVVEVSAFVAAAGMDGAASAGAGGEVGTAAATDWRAVGAFCQRMEQVWQRLGPLERKQQKQLNAAFELALQPLRQALQAQHEQAIVQREKLIGQVQQLTPQGRDTLDQLQRLQAQWQQDAKALPLARATEQQLWQHFRAACDAVFTQRKQAVVSADVERTANLAAKTALCLALEQALADPDATEVACAALLRDQRLAWNAIGPVPRAAQAALQTRFDQAVAAVQGQRDAARQRAGESQFGEFVAAWSACLACERQLLAAPNEAAQAVQHPWEARANLLAPLDQALRVRFNAAEAALTCGDTVYAQSLQENTAALATALLRLEVRLGLDSPAVFARERLQLQVAGLQSTFKSGSPAATADTPLLQFAQACALAAITDTVAQDRMKTIANAVLAKH